MKKELEKREFKVFVPSMPDTNNPQMESWMSFLTKLVGEPDKNCYFVGHSLGCITILRYLESLKGDQMVGGVIMVAGFSYDLEYPGYKGELSGFFKTKVNWRKVKKRCKKFIAIHSKDDQWVPFKHSLLFKEKLGAELILEQNMRHFSGDDGVTKLPIVLDSLLKISR